MGGTDCGGRSEKSKVHTQYPNEFRVSFVWNMWVGPNARRQNSRWFVDVHIRTRRSMGGCSPPSRSRVRVECPTLNSAKPQNIDFVDHFEDLELRGAFQSWFRRPFRGSGATRSPEPRTRRQLWRICIPREAASAGIPWLNPYPHIHKYIYI